MKPGKSLQELALEIERQSNAKHDYIAPAPLLTVDEGGRLNVPGTGMFPVTPTCETQIATYLDYPLQFFRRSREAHPGEWAALTNRMFSDHLSDKRMVRTLDGNARAFLSNRYRRIDNDQIAETVLGVVATKHGEWQVVSSEITDQRLYLKVLTPMVKALKVGDEVQSGFVISNSEIGSGQLSIERLIYRLRCTNGMILPDSGMHRKHLGSAMMQDENIRELMTDRTLLISDQALMAQVRDVLAATIDETHFGKQVEQFAATIGQPITGHPEKVVEVAQKKFGLSDGEGKSVLRWLIDQGDGLNRFGFANAITRTAQEDTVNYDRSVELERIGYNVVTLPPSEWKVISEAKAD